ncbi:3'-5' exonuclease [Candidatus Pantoea multigeneris]|uniref:DNA 3'-5' helicase II n=1 Tax=Candidatus Pantoea multigeneris TaxID=2608357 RepID=A0ABX0R7V9_9GAMM|nr:nuclease-related domain-containing DEAD/DEAH box helicase [Pantoea multigeneris]NIF20447.1 AAA family ATPase [Pantoea multigeneris]
MAKLITSLSTCSDRMTPGERRVAQRLESLLPDDCLIWYDIPVGRDHLHPDFIIIDPGLGLIFLEVKDWRPSTLRYASPQSVTLETDKGEVHHSHPLVQVKQYACATVNKLEQEPRLQQTGAYQGKLNLAWAYGVVFTNITRRQLQSLSANPLDDAIFPTALTICQDEMTETTPATVFRNKLSGLFKGKFRPTITPEIRDIVRQHLFPEIVIQPKKQANSLAKVMDIQQEVLARNIGEGHRVIHGVAGSGKTLILIYRCLYLAETLQRPVLVLCYNITLSNYLREQLAARGLAEKVHVFYFHAWCKHAVESSGVKMLSRGSHDSHFIALEAAQESGAFTDAGYDAVLIDEGHDFDSRWLTLIARLFDNQQRSLLLMYDDAQSLYRRERALNFSLASVGIQAQGRTSILRVNYRNPQSILNFAYAFSREYFEKHHNKEIPQVLPEACGELGADPVIISCDSVEKEAQHVLMWIKQKRAQHGRWGDIAILFPAKFSALPLCEKLSAEGIPFATCFEPAEKKRYAHQDDVVHLLTYQSSKGLEFPFVAVLNASFVPSKSEDETQAIPALYVAFTRATQELMVSAYRKNTISQHLESFATV